MLAALLVTGYLVALAALFGLGLVGKLPGSLFAPLLTGLGALTGLGPVVLLLRDATMPTALACTAIGFGAAALVGGVVAARTLPR